jgi:2-polyprenyl-3-methyl-5-hydroxy-6-metoxy-1,4-benzoquinol methylase
VKITPEYLELNRRLHATGEFGVSGSRWGPSVLQICSLLGTRDILDYGCGQRTLEKSLGFAIRNYDPCIPGVDTPPEPADIVVCTDVLEHVEPDCIDAVLDDLKRLTRAAALLVIANRPAKKVLPDGRNAHLIQQPRDWWLPRLAQRFAIHQVEGNEAEIVFIVRKRIDRFGGLAVY